MLFLELGPLALLFESADAVGFPTGMSRRRTSSCAKEGRGMSRSAVGRPVYLSISMVSNQFPCARRKTILLTVFKTPSISSGQTCIKSSTSGILLEYCTDGGGLAACSSRMFLFHVSISFGLRRRLAASMERTSWGRVVAADLVRARRWRSRTGGGGVWLGWVGVQMGVELLT